MVQGAQMLNGTIRAPMRENTNQTVRRWHSIMPLFADNEVLPSKRCRVRVVTASRAVVAASHNTRYARRLYKMDVGAGVV